MPNPKYKRGLVIYVTQKNVGTVTINAGEFVKRATNGIEVAGDGDTLHGIAHEDIEPGATGIVEIPVGAIYSVDLATGYDPTFSSKVCLASKNTVDGGTTGNVVAGIVIDEDPVAGGRARIALVSDLMHKETV